MNELYLEIFSDINDDGTFLAPLETAVSLFTFIYCNHPPILLTFVMTCNCEKKATFKLRIPNLLFEVINESELDKLPALCKLPVIITCDGTTVVAGLCAVLRQVVKIIDNMHSLLGFKQSCLYACAESSVWTKFCEVDIINTINILHKATKSQDFFEIPNDIARFEAHMLQPVRIHNIEKKKQDLAKLRSMENHLNDEINVSHKILEDLEHKYSEGHEMTLADIILLPSFYIIFETIGSVYLKQHIPLSYKWYETMLNKKRVKQGLKLFADIQKIFEKEIYVNYILPKVENQSLYKGEGKKRQPKRHFYTKQEDIDDSINTIEEMNTFIEVQQAFGHEVDFDWTSVPSEFCLDDSQIPHKRLERKSQQLQNMTKAVLKIAKNGDEIVDFCSGSGHLGLTLAHALPRCNVILLENKEQSLRRARERAAKLKLSNVVFCQSNVDYFKGHFNIGVSLHACGVATDLVMERCIREGAAFVCCPCCYGSIQSNHMISYPRSEYFRNSKLTTKGYFVLAHSSDQTHDNENVKTNQGNKCMIAIDSDRCLRAKEAGYVVTLSKLEPPSCTPKNNLLVGIPSSP